MSDNKFIDGLFVHPPRDKAPDFVKGAISIKVQDLGKWLMEHAGEEWINIDIKESKNGKWYAAVNDWKPEKKPEPVFDDDLPF